MRVAVTSTDGVNVDQHFGKAESFYVYDFQCGTVKFVEKRQAPYSYCSDREVPGPTSDHHFDEERLNNIFKVIHDCQRLYTLKIGEKPCQGLEALGMEVQPCHCPIDTLAGCSGNCSG